MRHIQTFSQNKSWTKWRGVGVEAAVCIHLVWWTMITVFWFHFRMTFATSMIRVWVLSHTEYVGLLTEASLYT